VCYLSRLSDLSLQVDDDDLNAGSEVGSILDPLCVGLHVSFSAPFTTDNPVPGRQISIMGDRPCA
jgi:hypothetical protein